VRRLVQVGFALVTVLVGLQFARFVAAARSGALPLPTRPPGVEAFLPISGLMGLVDWLEQGVLNPIHPAATVLVLVALGVSLLLRRAFCSWICPFGLLSEALAHLGRRLFGRSFLLPRWLDIPLRALKYLLLAFFLQAILAMPALALRAFLHSPYNRVADVKMYLFFAHLGTVGLAVIGVLLAGSLFVPHLWCRYLCPYGALLGLFSWMSPLRVRRNAALCTDCGRCETACLSRLPVARQASVDSPECTGCLDCVASCPRPGALAARAAGRRVSAAGIALAVVALFAGSWLSARALGAWDNAIDDREYVERLQEIDSPLYAHPR
jgi:polyferredoxin